MAPHKHSSTPLLPRLAPATGITGARLEAKGCSSQSKVQASAPVKAWLRTDAHSPHLPAAAHHSAVQAGDGAQAADCQSQLDTVNQQLDAKARYLQHLQGQPQPALHAPGSAGRVSTACWLSVGALLAESEVRARG